MTPRPRPAVAALPAYSRAAHASVTWRTASNEAPFGPGPMVLRAIAAASEEPHLYPTPTGELLTAALERVLGLPPEQIAVGGGSLALLQHALAAFVGPGDEVVHAWRSYEAYPIVIGVCGATGVPVPLDAEARHDVEAMLAAISPRTRAIIICNPNNPTGTVIEPSELERLVAGVPADVLVLLDEAYREFDVDAVDTLSWLSHFPNLVVLRTFSKAYALAGLRAGYAVGSTTVIEAIRKAAPPFGLNRVAEAAATAALDEDEHLARVVETVTTGRDAVRARLAHLGVWTPASAANFVWVPSSSAEPETVSDACRDRSVGVRVFPGEGARFTVGIRAAESAFAAAVASVSEQSLSATRS